MPSFIILKCRLQNINLVATVYATLGEEAVLFAFKEVAADTIFTSEALLLKVLNIKLQK